MLATGFALALALTAVGAGQGAAWADTSAPAAAGPVAAVTADAAVLGAPGAAPKVATASNGGPVRDSFDPTMRAAVALVLVGLFAATRSRTRAQR